MSLGNIQMVPYRGTIKNLVRKASNNAVGTICPPLFEIGLADLPNQGKAAVLLFFPAMQWRPCEKNPIDFAISAINPHERRVCPYFQSRFLVRFFANKNHFKSAGNHFHAFPNRWPSTREMMMDYKLPDLVSK